jgi:5'-deoxynucleotidase YfbR-like HD superfamily hydrolase
MSQSESRFRDALITYFPMFIATLSLITSIYNGYLNNKFVDIIQSNLGRAEYLKTCKEIIDAYFQVKFRAGLLSENAERERTGAAVPGAVAAEIDAANAVSRFAALGTYLANLRDETARSQYTQLSTELAKVIRAAGETPSRDLAKLFEPADRIFAELNEDCVRTAKR